MQGPGVQEGPTTTDSAAVHAAPAVGPHAQQHQHALPAAVANAAIHPAHADADAGGLAKHAAPAPQS